LTIHITDEEVKQLFTMPDAYDALHEAFSMAAAGDVLEPARLELKIPGGWLRLQPGAMPKKGYFGYKAYGMTSQKGIRYVVHLYDINSGDLLAIVDADTLTVVRTGADSGVATRYLSREDSRVLGVIGSGFQAGSLVDGVAHVRKLDKIRVYSRSLENREAFSARVEDRLGIKVEPVGAPSTAIKGSDIVGLATSNMGMTPVVSGDWFEPGMHINAIGAVGMGRVEVDNRTFERSSLVVVDALEDCIAGAQELIDALAAGAVRREQLVELSQIVSGKKPGRTSRSQITLLKSQGSGVQDVAAAARIYELASSKGFGTDIGDIAPALRQSK
jgi:ornithine cyclodeaminase